MMVNRMRQQTRSPCTCYTQRPISLTIKMVKTSTYNWMDCKTNHWQSGCLFSLSIGLLTKTIVWWEFSASIKLIKYQVLSYPVHHLVTGFLLSYSYCPKWQIPSIDLLSLFKQLTHTYVQMHACTVTPQPDVFLRCDVLKLKSKPVDVRLACLAKKQKRIAEVWRSQDSLYRPSQMKRQLPRWAQLTHPSSVMISHHALRVCPSSERNVPYNRMS